MKQHAKAGGEKSHVQRKGEAVTGDVRLSNPGRRNVSVDIQLHNLSCDQRVLYPKPARHRRTLPVIS